MKYLTLKNYHERNEVARMLRKVHSENPRYARILWHQYRIAYKMLHFMISMEISLIGEGSPSSLV